ncbi:MAG: hypothetical protein A3I89_03820 [Candidatus Harrisonbacteria bacterium RIFCSPLOWO2_02_FULL_41_11]|nr:MAG: hypothetical protein A3I89_03820 [Candidatus Harrisonbacteria bacterium RIFCSPLOWO2_02_FULL_41_11]
MRDQPKISIVEGILMLILALSADAAEALAAWAMFLPYFGQMVVIAAWIYGLSISGIIAFWLYFKGIKLGSFVVGNIIEFIPLINSLPGRSGGVIATIIKTNLLAVSLPNPSHKAIKKPTLAQN